MKRSWAGQCLTPWWEGELDPGASQADSQCRLLVNRRSAVRRRCAQSLSVCILEQSHLFHGAVF